MMQKAEWVRAGRTGSVLLYSFYASFRLAEAAADDGVAEFLIRTEWRAKSKKAKAKMVEWLGEEIFDACNGQFPLLLLFEIDRLVFVAGDALANLGGGLACFVLREGIEGFFRAGGTFRAVQTLIAAAQTGVAESAVTTAVAGKL